MSADQATIDRLTAEVERLARENATLRAMQVVVDASAARARQQVNA